MTKEYDFKQNNDGWFYSELNPRVRFRFEEYEYCGEIVNNFFFEIKKRPYFFGLIGKIKWDFVVQTNGFTEGVSLCNFILKSTH